MTNPIRAILARTKTGYSVGEKIALTLVTFVYVASPIDLVPDLLPLVGQLDDLSALILLAKVLMSPTLPPTAGGSTLRAS